MIVGDTQKERNYELHGSRKEKKDAKYAPAPALTPEQENTQAALRAAFSLNPVNWEAELRKSGVFGEEPRPEDVKPAEKVSQ